MTPPHTHFLGLLHPHDINVLSVIDYVTARKAMKKYVREYKINRNLMTSENPVILFCFPWWLWGAGVVTTRRQEVVRFIAYCR